MRKLLCEQVAHPERQIAQAPPGGEPALRMAVGAIRFTNDAIGLALVVPMTYAPKRNTPSRDAMADLVPIPLDLFERLRRAGLDVDAILRRAKLPRSRFSV